MEASARETRPVVRPLSPPVTRRLLALPPDDRRGLDAEGLAGAVVLLVVIDVDKGHARFDQSPSE